jgi:hypothetical protein
MDDYCMQSRGILRHGEGYEFCLRRIASLPEKTWLLNQHVEPMFRFTRAQIGRMQSELTKRICRRGRRVEAERYEAMHASRKGQVRSVAKGDPVAQREFIHTIFGIAA